MRNFKVYEKIFNIELFNSIVTFVMFTTDKDKNKLLRFLEENHIWFKAKYKNNVIEKYQFKYLGELLERYEEKIGTNIEDISISIFKRINNTTNDYRKSRDKFYKEH